MSSIDEVRKASEQFYTAMNGMLDGDAGPLADIWSHGKEVTTMHPVGGREVGWDEVWGKWQSAAKLFSGGHIKLDDQIIRVAGDFAYEVGIEKGVAKHSGNEVSVDCRATNIYRKEAGTWKIVHHHADVSPSMMDLLNQ